MRYLCICVCVLIPSLVAAGEDLPVRPVDALAAAALERAIERSATARSLVKRLESSNVIVHVESSRTLPLGIGGMTRF
ncbi:MAG TPA: hypothetical protein VNT81_00895, partial [Vicinamibacterales bacterium]|nr:hypothetical protein [Vicinamibacterales bacterium]